MRGVEEGSIVFHRPRQNPPIERSVTAKTCIYIYLSFATTTCPHLPVSAPIHIECRPPPPTPTFLEELIVIGASCSSVGVPFFHSITPPSSTLSSTPDTDLGIGVFLPHDIEGHDVEMMPQADGGDAGEVMRGPAP